MVKIKDINCFNLKSAWWREQLVKDSSWKYYLTFDDINEINSALQNVQKNKNHFYNFTKDSFPLPNLGKVLNYIVKELENGYGVFLIRGLPVRKYSYEELKIIYLGINSHIGTLVNQNNSGELISDIKDKGEKWGSLAGRGSGTSDPLPFHSDRCDVVSLLCISKPVSGGESKVVSSVTIHNELLKRRADLLEVLYQPFYHRRALWETDETLFYMLPIFTVYNNYFACRYLRLYIDLAQDLDNVPRLKPIQLEALLFLEKIANDSNFYIETEFELGDIQFLNNHVTLHSRCYYEDGSRSDQKRHLLRSWIAVPNSRPLSPDFKLLFKNTEPGSIRGGA